MDARFEENPRFSLISHMGPILSIHNCGIILVKVTAPVAFANELDWSSDQSRRFRRIWSIIFALCEILFMIAPVGYGVRACFRILRDWWSYGANDDDGHGDVIPFALLCSCRVFLVVFFQLEPDRPIPRAQVSSSRLCKKRAGPHYLMTATPLLIS